MVLEEKPDRYDHQKNNATVALVVFKMTASLASNVKVAGWVGQGEGVKIGKNGIFHLSYLLPLASSPSILITSIVRVLSAFYFFYRCNNFSNLSIFSD